MLLDRGAAGGKKDSMILRALHLQADQENI